MPIFLEYKIMSKEEEFSPTMVTPSRLAEPGAALGWRPSSLAPLEAVLPKELHITPAQLQFFDRAMFALSSAEPKAVTLLHGLARNPRNVHEIYRAMQGTLPAGTWTPKYMALNNYMHDNFCPVGLITEESDGYSHRFSLTKDAMKVVPIAACLLKHTAENDIPASVVLKRGATAEDGKRTYINRSAVLLYLYSGDTYKSKLMQVTGLGSATAKESLHSFRDLGLIDYEFADPETPGWGIYERVGDSAVVKHSPTHNRLRRNMVEYFQANPIGNPQTIAKALERTDLADIITIASQLVEDGFLRRRDWHGGVRQSNAQIRTEGRLFVDNVLLPVLRFCADDPSAIAQMREILAEVRSSPGISAQAIRRYKEEKYKVPKAETSASILDLIRESGPQRPQQILSALGSRAEPVIIDLLREGRLTKKRNGKAVYYFFPTMAEPTHEKSTTLLEYHQPEDLLPPTCRPKEEYRAELEAQAFWDALHTDIMTIPPGTGTERRFYWFYSPENQRWYEKDSEKDNFKLGKYSSYVIALRNLGARNPYKFLRDYQPGIKDEGLVSSVQQAQTAIRERLLETRGNKNWQDYLLDLHSIDFWQQLRDDVVTAPNGITTFQFLYFFNRDNPNCYDQTQNGTYANLYHVFRAHTGEHADFIRTFSPSLSQDPSLAQLILEVQRMMTEKFVLAKVVGETTYAPDFLADSDYWEKVALEKQQELPKMPYSSFSVRVARFTDALKVAGLQTVSTPIVAHHLAGRYQAGIADSIQSEFDDYRGAIVSREIPNQGANHPLERVKYFLNIDQRIISALEQWRQEPDVVLGQFIDGVVTRLIREDLYARLGNLPISDITFPVIQKSLLQAREGLRSIAASDRYDYLDEQIKCVYLEFSGALEQTKHLQEFFTHPLSLEQLRVINSLAASEGHDLLAHPPAEGKTAMALAGTWEYFRRNEVNNGVILFLGPVSAVDNLQRNVPGRLNPEIPGRFVVADWTQETSVADKYGKLLDAIRNHGGPLILPISYSMLEPKFINEFNSLLNNLQYFGRPYVPVADEVHHCLGYKTIYTQPGLAHKVPIVPISGLSDNGMVVAVEKPQSFLPVDYLLRATSKNVLISGTPLNTGLAQLLHLASLMESRPDNNRVAYPSFEQVKGWIDDPLTLSAVFQQHMHRSSHLPLPNVQHIVLECDFQELPQSTRADLDQLLASRKNEHQLWQLGLEFKTIFPFLLPVLNKNQNSPVVISVPYVDENKVTGPASTRRIAAYLRMMGFYGVSGLDSRLSKESLNTAINQFREDDGTDIIVISPALGESRDLHSTTRPANLVISIGASTLRGYEQAIRRIIRTGNSAETVYVVTPVPKNFPAEYSLLERRHDMLQERLETATAILDPVNFIRTEEAISSDKTDDFLTGELGINNTTERKHFTSYEEPLGLIASEEEVAAWNNSNIVAHVNSLKDGIAALREYQKPVIVLTSPITYPN